MVEDSVKFFRINYFKYVIFYGVFERFLFSKTKNYDNKLGYLVVFTDNLYQFF